MPKRFRGDVRVLYFIRFGISYTQPCINTVIAKLPIHNCYRGRVVGIAKHVDVLECSNQWPGNVNVIVLEFEDMEAAQKWFDCVPEIKQHDWLSGADHVALEVNETPENRIVMPETGEYLQILDMDIPDENDFMQNYVQDAEPVLRQWGAAPAVASTDTFKVFRGLWNPNHIVVNRWKCADSFDKAYNCDHYAPLKQKRMQYANSDVVFFKMESIWTHDRNRDDGHDQQGQGQQQQRVQCNMDGTPAM